MLQAGTQWVRKTRRKLPSLRRCTFVTDLWHAPVNAIAVVATRRLGETAHEIKANLKAGNVHEAVARLEPRRSWSPNVATCIDVLWGKRNRLPCDECVRRGIQTGSGVIKSMGRRASDKRCKHPGGHSANTGANHLLTIKSCMHVSR